MELNKITNYYQVNPNLATSGQPTSQQFQDIRNAGYSVILNLALASSDNALPNEGSIVTRLGMSYFHIPVVWEAPTLEDVNLFFSLMEGLSKQKVWVHCVLNLRVSCFVYLFQKYILKLPEEQARYPMDKLWQPQGVWQQLIDDVQAEFSHL